MDTTHHQSTDTIGNPGTGRVDDAILHLDSGEIDTTIELLEAAGLEPRLVCDGSCGGASGCSLAPIGADAIAA